MNLLVLAFGLCVLASYICFEVARAIAEAAEVCPHCSARMKREGRALRCVSCGCVVTTRYGGKFKG